MSQTCNSGDLLTQQGCATVFNKTQSLGRTLLGQLGQCRGVSWLRFEPVHAVARVGE